MRTRSQFLNLASSRIRGLVNRDTLCGKAPSLSKVKWDRSEGKPALLWEVTIAMAIPLPAAAPREKRVGNERSVNRLILPTLRGVVCCYPELRAGKVWIEDGNPASRGIVGIGRFLGRRTF